MNRLRALVEARTVELADAQSRLHIAQWLQRSLLDKLPDILWVKDQESRFLAMNRAEALAMGVDQDEIVGKTDFDIWPRQLAEKYRADDQEVMRTRRLLRVEEPHLYKDGNPRWVETLKVPILNDEGELIGTGGIARDITERKEAEEILRRSHAELEEMVQERTSALHEANEALKADISERIRTEAQQRRLVAILEATTDLVGIADMQGRILYLNRAGRRLIGFGEEEDVSATMIQDCHPAWAGALLQEVGLPTAMRDGVWSGETALKTRRGQEIPVSQVLLIHRDGTGLPEFASSIARDISERKALEAQLRQSQKMEGIGRLAGGIAHDFNNLLSAILCFTEIALEERGPADPRRADLQAVRRAAARGADLTRQLLAFARKQVIEPQIVDLNDLILATHHMLRRLIGEDIELVTLPVGAPALVSVDPGQFEQVLVNLAVNARDAMPRGGKLTIETRNVQAGDDLTTRHPGAVADSVLLILRDTGVGMDEATLSHIFEPFFTTKPVGKGTGLGLAMSYGIVQQAGGHIWVNSSPGMGTTFEICLPKATQAQIAPAPSEGSGALRGGTETILLVEDEPLLRAMVARVLATQGYRVIIASSGSEALAAAREHEGPIHLLLSDIVMPHMSGSQTAALLRRERPDLKVLYMSGYAANGMEQRGVLPEPVSLLLKPFTREALIRRVREELDRSTGILLQPEARAEANAEPSWEDITGYEGERRTGHGAAVGTADLLALTPPPLSELARLLYLADRGLIRDVLNELSRLEGEDPRLEPWVGQVRAVAQRYQTRRLRDLLRAQVDVSRRGYAGRSP